MERYRTVRSKADKLPLDVLEVIPEGEVIGIVQIVHGMQEHKERYLHFMRYLGTHGFACIAADHRGHGKSIREPEDLGYFYDPHGKAIVEDLEVTSAHLRLEYPHVPFFMLAHSMGTLVARKYIKDHDRTLSGLILSGPVYNNPAAKTGRRLVDALSRVQGDKHVSKTVSKLVEGSFDRQVEGTQKNRWLSTNEESVEAFNQDPLCGHPFTLNGYRNLLLLVEDVYSEQGWKVAAPDLPILFAGGENDPVIGSPQEFENQAKFLESLGYRHVHRHLYPHMRHEILNEINREHVYEEFAAFFKEHLK